MASPPTERVVFSSIIDSYLRGLGDLITPKAHAELKAAGLNLGRLPPAFPEKQMLDFAEILARNAWPQEQRPEALRRLGFQMIKGWQSTLLGSAGAAVMKLVGPERSLPRLNRAFRTTNNFSECTFELVAPREALVTVNDVQGMPTYWQGVLQAGMAMVTDKGTVTIDKLLPGPDATFRMTWK